MLLYLIGFTRSGKSHFACELSTQWRVPVYDTDIIFESENNISITQFVNEQGWEAFRKCEYELLLRIGRECDPSLSIVSGIVATGGGTVLYPQSADFLRDKHKIWVHTDWDTIAERITKNPSAICIGKSISELKQLYNERVHFYKALLNNIQ